MNRYPSHIPKWGIDLRPIIAYGFSVLGMTYTEMSYELCISRERIRQLGEKAGISISYRQCEKCGNTLKRVGKICRNCSKGRKEKAKCRCGRTMLRTSKKCAKCNDVFQDKYNWTPQAIERRKKYYAELKSDPVRYQEHLKKNRERARLKKAGIDPFWIKVILEESRG